MTVIVIVIVRLYQTAANANDIPRTEICVEF